MKKAMIFGALVAVFSAMLLVVGLSRSGGQQDPKYPGALDNLFCADANGDGAVDISDAITILNHLFMGDKVPLCKAEDLSLQDLFVDEGQPNSITTGMLVDGAVTSQKIAGGHGSGVDADTVDGVHGTELITTAPRTMYVSTDGDDGHAGTADAPKATILGALSSIPAIVAHTVTIRVADGEYVDDQGVHTDCERQFINNSRIAIIGNEADKEAVHWTSTTPARAYNFKNVRLFMHDLKISGIRLNFMNGTYAAMESMYFQWHQANALVVHPFAWVSLSGRVTIRSTADTYEGLITVEPHGYLSFSGVDARDDAEKKGVLLVVNGCGFLNLTPGTVGGFDPPVGNMIANFDVGIALGTFGAAPNSVPPMAAAVIEGGQSPPTVIRDCNTGLKIRKCSHAVYRWGKPQYLNNTIDEDAEDCSSYKLGQ